MRDELLLFMCYHDALFLLGTYSSFVKVETEYILVIRVYNSSQFITVDMLYNGIVAWEYAICRSYKIGPW